MNLQLTMEGKEEYVGTDTSQVWRLLDLYPAYADDTGKLMWLIAKERCPWISQQPANRQAELKDVFESAENIRRRRQDYKASHPVL